MTKPWVVDMYYLSLLPRESPRQKQVVTSPSASCSPSRASHCTRSRPHEVSALQQELALLECVGTLVLEDESGLELTVPVY